MACPGSIQLLRRVPLGKISIYAEEGTAAHELAQYCLETSTEPSDYYGKEWSGIASLDAEFVDAVTVYTSYVRGRMLAAQWFSLERQFYLDPLQPPVPMYGTSDFVAVVGHMLEVVDYKHGKGVVVEVTDNKQARYYALGALMSLREEQAQAVDTVEMTVIQPRAYHPDGPVRSERITVLELVDYALDLFEAVNATLAPEAPLKPGEHCRFCAAHAVCPAVRDNALAVARNEFAATPPQPALLDPDELGQLMGRFDQVEKWMAAVRAHAYDLLMAGGAIPGWKLVPKRANRKWVSEEKTLAWTRKEKLKREQVYELPSLLSPAALEKVIGRGKIPAELIKQESTGLTLAEAHDPRPAATVLTAAEEFAALPE